MTQEAKIEIASPRIFNNASVLIIGAYGMILLVPVFFSLLAITLLRPGFLTILIPLLALAMTAWVVPIGQGNHYIARRMKSVSTSAEPGETTFLVQLTLTPRIRKGLRALLEDADDFGLLIFQEDRVVFNGDSVQISVPYANITSVHRQNVGLRGRFVYGSRVAIEVKGLPNATFLEFAERSSAFVAQSKRISRELLEQFQRASAQN